MQTVTSRNPDCFGFVVTGVPHSPCCCVFGPVLSCGAFWNAAVCNLYKPQERALLFEQKVLHKLPCCFHRRLPLVTGQTLPALTVLCPVA